jgi:hypothetical protein
MTEFSENPRDFLLSESYRQHYLGDLFAELYALFRNENISPQAGQNGTVTDTNLKALQLVINDIHILRMDSHEKLSEIEEVLLYMHLITEATLHGLPPNNEHLSLLVKELIRRHQLTTNPRNEITTVKELVSECEDIKPHSYQNLVIEKLTQLQKKVYKEIIGPNFEVFHSTNKEETSSQPKEEEDIDHLDFTYTQPKYIPKIADLVKIILQSSTQYSDLTQEFEKLFWEERTFWERIEDCYRKISSDWQNLDATNFKRIVERELEKWATKREEFTSDAVGVSPLDTYDEFHIINGANESEILQKVAIEAGVQLNEENLPIIYAERKALEEYVEELKRDLKKIFWYDCHCRLYKMALDGSLFGEQNTVKGQPKKPIPQPVPQNRTAFFLLIVAVSHLKLVEGTDEILLNGECKIEKEKLTIKKIANWAMETFGVSYDDRETLYTTLYRYQRKDNNFLPKVRENVIGVLTYHYPEKAKEIESILDKIIPDKKNS